MLTITSYSWTFPVTFLLFLLFFSCSESCTFTLTNSCPYTVWPGTLAGAGTPQLPTTGFQLDSGRSVRIASVPGWSGRIWARTGCKFDESGVGTCETGDCGGRLECDGNGATPPASLFEITLGKGNDKDFYDVSIVDGYNLPLVAQPRGVYGACNATGSFDCMLLCCLHKSSSCMVNMPPQGEGIRWFTFASINSRSHQRVTSINSRSQQREGSTEGFLLKHHLTPSNADPSYPRIAFSM